MTDQSALLAAILAQPEDDTVRLVYADWLAEHGGQEERAEFIRVQCDIERNPGFQSPELDPRRRREREMWATCWGWANPFIGDLSWFRRGFVESVTCSTEDWIAHADEIHWHPGQDRPCPVTAQPLKRVTFTERDDRIAGIRLALSQGFRQFRLAGRVARIKKKAEPTEANVFAAFWPGIEFVVPAPTAPPNYPQADFNPLFTPG